MSLSCPSVLEGEEVTEVACPQALKTAQWAGALPVAELVIRVEIPPDRHQSADWLVYC